MTNEQTDKLRSTLVSFIKDNGIDIKTDKDFSKYLIDFGASLSLEQPKVTHTATEPNWGDMHKKLVDLLIKFFNNNPQLKDLIKEAQEEFMRINKSKCSPISTLSLTIDNIEDSIDYNEWTPYTDSSLTLNVSTINILESV